MSLQVTLQTLTKARFTISFRHSIPNKYTRQKWVLLSLLLQITGGSFESPLVILYVLAAVHSASSTRVEYSSAILEY